MNPELSIIVPVYNVKNYIDKCINSILKQVFDEFELILIDDGSADGSEKICDMYAQQDARVVVIHKKNSGVSAARNKGLELSRGKYVMFIDADDWIEPQMCEFLIDNLEANKLDVIACAYTVECNEFTSKYAENGTNLKLFNSIQACKALFEGKYFHPGVVLRIYKKYLFNNELFCENITHGEDYIMSWKIFKKANKVGYSPNKLYHYVQRSDSASHKFTNNRFLEIEAKYLVYQEVKITYPALVDFAFDQYIRTFIMIGFNILDNDDKLLKKEFVFLQNQMRSQLVLLLKNPATNIGYKMCAILLLFPYRLCKLLNTILFKYMSLIKHMFIRFKFID